MISAVIAYGMANRIPYCTGPKPWPFKPLVKNVMQPYAAQLWRKYSTVINSTVGVRMREKSILAFEVVAGAFSFFNSVSIKSRSSAEIHFASRGWSRMQNHQIGSHRKGI